DLPVVLLVLGRGAALALHQPEQPAYLLGGGHRPEPLRKTGTILFIPNSVPSAVCSPPPSRLVRPVSTIIPEARALRTTCLMARPSTAESGIRGQMSSGVVKSPSWVARKPSRISRTWTVHTSGSSTWPVMWARARSIFIRAGWLGPDLGLPSLRRWTGL